MATVYSEEVAVGSYNRIRLKCDYSGTSASVDIQFRRTSTYTTTWADSTATLTLNGQEKNASYSYTGTVGTDWVTLVSGISGYAISTSGGTYSWAFNNPQSASVLGCSGSITIPSQATSPSGGYISTVVPGTDSFTLTGGVTSMGTGGSQTYVELLVLNAPYTPDGIPHRYEGFNTLSDTKTITNSSPAASGGITISPNTQYYVGVYANNGAADAYRYDGGAYSTLAEAPTVSAGTITDTSVVINYSATADGGQYDKAIQYSLDGATWVTGATITGGSAVSGTFTITGLTAGTSYSIQTRVSTAAGTTTGMTLSVTTTGGASPKLYGPVSDGVGGYQTELAEKLYGPIDDGNGGYETVRVEKLYWAVSDGNGGYVTKLIYEDTNA